MKVGIAQTASILLNRDATLARVVDWIDRAARDRCELVCFGETFVPGYPAWLSRTNGAQFNAPEQKAMHARYLEQAVTIEDGHLDPVRDAARRGAVAVVLGIAERPRARGGHTLYCTCVKISASGEMLSAHRKLMPTYEERLAWGIGDGAGLVTHRIGAFTVGALNCWENWMPAARAALYAGGENLHVAIWPGSDQLTRDITRFIALESRSYVVSACGLIRGSDFEAAMPSRGDIVGSEDEVLYNGGSCIAAPDGTWVIEPVPDDETLLVAELDPVRVLEERQNFDPSGHYARPDVFELRVNRTRQSLAKWLD